MPGPPRSDPADLPDPRGGPGQIAPCPRTPRRSRKRYALTCTRERRCGGLPRSSSVKVCVGTRVQRPSRATLRCTMRATCCAAKRRPVRLTCPSAVRRAATARSDRREARSSRARAIVACSRSSTTSLTPSASSAKPKGTDPMRAPRARLAASAAHVRDRIKPCSYLGCAVDHRADERVGRRIAVALTADTHDAGGFERHGGLHAAREHDVTGDPVASCDDEYVRGVLAQGRERRTQRGPCGDGRDAAHAVIGVPHGHPDALADRPGLDGGALGLSRETLFVLRRAQVGDCDARTSGGGALAHATRRTEHGGGTRHAAGGGCRPEAPRSPRDRCSLIGRDQEVCRRRRGAGRRTARSSPPRAFAPSGTAPG